MTLRNGWLCPCCGGAHGPHVDTCPSRQSFREVVIPTTLSVSELMKSARAPVGADSSILKASHQRLATGGVIGRVSGTSGQIMEKKMDTNVESTSDKRVVNNAVRHQYRVLSDAEKAKMQAVKDKGLEFLTLIDGLRTPAEPVEGQDFAVVTVDRELNIAAERVEEAVMWAVKHITA